MRAWSALLLAFFLGQQDPARPPALTEPVALSLVKRAPGFAPPSTREALAVVRMMAIPESQDRGYFAEVTWREGQKVRGALVSIARAEVDPAPGMKWVVRDQQWGILSIQLDKTWQDLINELKAAQMSSSESAVIGRLRAFASGQATYAAVAGGSYAGNLECLVKPESCGIASTIGFVDDSFQNPERSGYRFTLHPGPIERSSPSAPAVAKNYAYTAEPITPGVTGRRSFCIDERARLCAADEAALAIKNGACPVSCKPIK